MNGRLPHASHAACSEKLHMTSYMLLHEGSILALAAMQQTAVSVIFVVHSLNTKSACQ